MTSPWPEPPSSAPPMPTSASSACATNTSAARDGVLQTASDAEDVGFAVRVIHRGAWGFASGVVLTAEEARRVAETGDRGRGGGRRDDHHAGRSSRPSRSTTTSPGSRPTTSTRSRCPPPRRRPCSPSGRTGCASTPASRHATADLQQVQENKYYADLAGTRTTQQRVRLQPGFEAMGSDEKTGIFDSMSSIAPPVGRGWEYLTDGSYDWDAELAEVPELLAEKLVAPSVEAGQLRPRHPPVQPVADHPRVHRPRHRARPGPGLRGQLRRHVVRDLRQARHPAVRLGDHERHRRPHAAARARDGRLRRRGRPDPGVGHRQGRRAGGLPARPVHGAHEARAARGPLQRLCLRRLAGPHPDPADGQRLAAGGTRRSRAPRS